MGSFIILPILAQVGCNLANGVCPESQFRLLVIGSVLILMALPVTSFPNAQCFALTVKKKKLN